MSSQASSAAKHKPIKTNKQQSTMLFRIANCCLLMLQRKGNRERKIKKQPQTRRPLFAFHYSLFTNHYSLFTPLIHPVFSPTVNFRR
ncbi:MAG: hypothetical protein RLZZ519_1428 [Bacteroidota bacterium]|jgi:hypothetical protein